MWVPCWILVGFDVGSILVRVWLFWVFFGSLIGFYLASIWVLFRF